MNTDSDPGATVIDDRQHMLKMLASAIIVFAVVLFAFCLFLTGPGPILIPLLILSAIPIILGTYIYRTRFFSISQDGIEFPKRIGGLTKVRYEEIIKARLARANPELKENEHLVLLLRDGSWLRIWCRRDLEMRDFRSLKEYLNLDYDKRRISFLSVPDWDGSVN